MGTVWTVPFSLLTPAPTDSKPLAVEPVSPAPLDLAHDGRLGALAHRCYIDLSPENLTCDGELSGSLVRRRASALRSKLRALFVELGRPVNEDEAYGFASNGR